MRFEHGYERIGLDHFALPADRLAIAAREGTLRRNFQGYTDDNASTLIAFGASSISALPGGYAQNIVETGAYARAVLRRQPSNRQGDRVRRAG